MPLPWQGAIATSVKPSPPRPQHASSRAEQFAVPVRVHPNAQQVAGSDAPPRCRPGPLCPCDRCPLDGRSHAFLPACAPSIHACMQAEAIWDQRFFTLALEACLRQRPGALHVHALPSAAFTTNCTATTCPFGCKVGRGQGRAARGVACCLTHGLAGGREGGAWAVQRGRRHPWPQSGIAGCPTAAKGFFRCISPVCFFRRGAGPFPSLPVGGACKQPRDDPLHGCGRAAGPPCDKQPGVLRRMCHAVLQRLLGRCV